MNIDLKHLQHCELLIADEIKRICEKNNITYFLITGSMLGAIRHGGFIPWDDDMDFGMLREQYEKFREACKTDLNDKFFFEDWNNSDNYPFSYGKVRLKNTVIEELFAPKEKNNQAIFVDVFPYDNSPDDEIKQRRQAKKVFMLRRILWMKKGYGKIIKKEGIKQRIKYDVFRMLFFFLPYKIIKRSLEKELIKYNGEKTCSAFMDSVYSYKKNQIQIKWTKSLREYQFDGHIYPGFCSSNEYLTHLYNDYMELPPEAKRHNHDIVYVDFGQY